MQTVRFRASSQSRGTETAFTPQSFRAGLPRARGVPCELGDPPACSCAARAASLPPSGETLRGACLRRALPGPAACLGWGCFPASAPASARAGDSREPARRRGFKRWDARPHRAAGMSAPRPRCLLLGQGSGRPLRVPWALSWSRASPAHPRGRLCHSSTWALNTDGPFPVPTPPTPPDFRHVCSPWARGIFLTCLAWSVVSAEHSHDSPHETVAFYPIHHLLYDPVHFCNSDA